MLSSKFILLRAEQTLLRTYWATGPVWHVFLLDVLSFQNWCDCLWIAYQASLRHFIHFLPCFYAPLQGSIQLLIWLSRCHLNWCHYVVSLSSCFVLVQPQQMPTWLKNSWLRPKESTQTNQINRIFICWHCRAITGGSSCLPSQLISLLYAASLSLQMLNLPNIWSRLVSKKEKLVSLTLANLECITTASPSGEHVTMFSFCYLLNFYKNLPFQKVF